MLPTAAFARFGAITIDHYRKAVHTQAPTFFDTRLGKEVAVTYQVPDPKAAPKRVPFIWPDPDPSVYLENGLPVPDLSTRPLEYTDPFTQEKKSVFMHYEVPGAYVTQQAGATTFKPCPTLTVTVTDEDADKYKDLLANTPQKGKGGQIILNFMADHGLKIPGIRLNAKTNTLVGQLIEALPVPDGVKSVMKTALDKNFGKAHAKNAADHLDRSAWKLNQSLPPAEKPFAASL